MKLPLVMEKLLLARMKWPLSNCKIIGTEVKYISAESVTKAQTTTLSMLHYIHRQEKTAKLILRAHIPFGGNEADDERMLPG